tara:strand:- start:358 stop:687 length:330 start_codon:yes stop_codon:yes gene_type:complete
MIRLKLGVTGGRFLVRRRAISVNPNAGELTTQNDLFLLTQDGRSIEVNQDIVENFQNITTQNEIQLLTQDGREIISNQNLVDDFPGLLTQDGLEFITQNGRHILTNVAD